jgi:protein-S-isoprenylcysteine O-methyltransferase Ste14
MSLMPAFELGLWNAWIFTIWLLLQILAIRLFNKEVYKKTGQPPDMKPGRMYKIIGYISTPMWLLATAYSIFLPFKLGTIWFAIGLSIFLLGLMINTIATINFAATPVNEPVTRGVYRYSRHPIYMALLLIYLGVGIASASWVFLLLTVEMAVEVSFSVTDEECYCLERYGNAYSEYIKNVPRWIRIPK